MEKLHARQTASHAGVNLFMCLSLVLPEVRPETKYFVAPVRIATGTAISTAPPRRWCSWHPFLRHRLYRPIGSVYLSGVRRMVLERMKSPAAQ